MNRKKLDDCPFSTRLLNFFRGLLLNGEDVIYIDQLIQFTASELLEKRYIGIKGIREIRKVLASEGYSLKGDILFDSEAEKKLIQDMPKMINEISGSLRELERKISWIRDALDQLHCNMQPIEKEKW